LDSAIQDRILRIDVCRSDEMDMIVFLFLEKGERPKAVARIEWPNGPILLTAFSSLPLPFLEECVQANVRSLSRQLRAGHSPLKCHRGGAPGIW
jgi:hypothetical protein